LQASEEPQSAGRAQVTPASQFPVSPGVRGHAGICAL